MFSGEHPPALVEPGLLSGRLANGLSVRAWESGLQAEGVANGRSLSGHLPTRSRPQICGLTW